MWWVGEFRYTDGIQELINWNYPINAIWKKTSVALHHIPQFMKRNSLKWWKPQQPKQTIYNFRSTTWVSTFHSTWLKSVSYFKPCANPVSPHSSMQTWYLQSFSHRCLLHQMPSSQLVTTGAIHRVHLWERLLPRRGRPTLHGLHSWVMQTQTKTQADFMLYCVISAVAYFSVVASMS